MTRVTQVSSAGRLASALAWRLWLAFASRVLAGWAFAAGALVLGWRLVRGSLPGPSVAVLALVALALGLLVAYLLARRRLPAVGELLVVLDDAGHAGGLLCALAAGVQLNGWPLPVLARGAVVRWQWRPAARVLLAAGAFLAGAALLPVPTASARARQRLQADQAAGALREQMAVLAEEELASPEQLRTWHEQLRQALESADGQDPVKTWEALDYLGEALAGKTSEALRSAQEWEAAMQQAETALAAMEALAASDAMSATEQCRALGLLANQLRAGAEQAGATLPPELQQALEDALAGATPVALTPEQLRRLRELLRQQRQARQLTPEQLARLRCLSPEELRALLDALDNGCGNCADPEALALALCQSENGCVSAEGLLAACAGGLPGRGGISRGRGDAALTWSGHTEPAAGAFSPEALPAAGRLDLEQAHVQGLSYAAPQEKTDVTLGNGVLGAVAGTSRTRTHTVLPRHRSAVEAYFGRSR